MTDHPDDETQQTQTDDEMLQQLRTSLFGPSNDPADTTKTGRLHVPREGRYVPGPSGGATEIREFIEDLFAPRYP